MYRKLRDRPIFICGHPKSGTSLLRALLDGHPQLVVYPEESVFFKRFLPKTIGMNLDEQLALAEQCLIHIFTWNQEAPPASQEDFPDRDYSAISFDDVREQMRGIITSNPPRHPGDILSAAVIAFGLVVGQATPSAKFWLEKSPYNEQYTENIFSWWPRARCLYVVRDPRDNYFSYYRKHPDWEPEFFAKNWVKSAITGIQNRARYGEESCRVIRYEDLVQSPKDTLTQLCEFLDIDFLPELANPTRAGVAWAGNSMFEQEFEAISTAPVGRWREQVSSSDAAVIASMTKPQLRTFGYPSADQDPLSARVRAAAWPLRRRVLKFTNRRNKAVDKSNIQFK
ncbi:MAG: sulfotransferase [Chloroflexi bacterium]|nr:sulfotransferase [Chloroflexota bacterium]